jgi:hypothetical protein
MKCAAALNGPGSLLSNIRLIIRCSGKKVSRNKPANAIVNFLVIDENKILLIGYEVFRICLIAKKGSLSKLNVLNQIYNFMLFITKHPDRFGYISIIENWLPLQS